VLLAAEVAAHLDLLALSQDALGLFHTQAADHAPTRSRLQVQAKRGDCGSKRISFSSQNRRRRMVSTSSVSSSSRVSVAARMEMRL
jgi:hypothetical protein